MFTARITPPDGGEPFIIATDSRDVVEWELSDRKNYLGLLEERASMVSIGELLFFAGRREGRISVGPKEFVRTYKIDRLKRTDDDDDEVGPT